MPPVKKQKTVRLGKVGVGAIFQFVNLDGNVEAWKVIGRPHRSGVSPEGKNEWWVPCSYVLRDKHDQGVAVPVKSFNLKSEVVLLRGGQRDPDAIDQRDQPKGVTSLDKLAGVPDELKKDLRGDEDTDLEKMIGDDEEVANDDV